MNITTKNLAEILYYSIAYDAGGLPKNFNKQPKKIREQFVKMAIAARRHFAQVVLGSEIPRHVVAQGEKSNSKPRGKRKRKGSR